MKIAIPIWENRVSPLFDTAGHILLAVGKDNEIEKQELLNVESLTIFQRIDLLKKLKIDVFICGGITKPILENIRNKDIPTIPFVCGEVEDLLHAQLAGKDVKNIFSMPGKIKKESE